MNKCLGIIMLTTVLLCCAGLAHAQVAPPVDFDTSLDRYDEQIGALLVDQAAPTCG
ncbi:MAG TPA: hypothetical protein PKI11_13265 [Candidatus Hydrogenedentes bacterium]|nr:hypothetical protein [Candidatus Hydrogenedentota bacterium]